LKKKVTTERRCKSCITKAEAAEAAAHTVAKAVGSDKKCVACGNLRNQCEFSKTQWAKADPKCRICMAIETDTTTSMRPKYNADSIPYTNRPIDDLLHLPFFTKDLETAVDKCTVFGEMLMTIVRENMGQGKNTFKKVLMFILKSTRNDFFILQDEAQDQAIVIDSLRKPVIPPFGGMSFGDEKYADSPGTS
jgi:hypothetical protein